MLLVEEEVLIAMDVEQICQGHGAASVRTVSTAVAVEALCADENAVADVDAAILDVKIGSLLTMELARKLEERNVPFVFATGYARSDPFFTAFPDVAVVTKPYAAVDLMGALAAAIRLRGSSHEG